MQLLDAGAAAHVVERLQARPAEPDLVEYLRELVGERVLEFFRQASDGGIEAEARFDRDGQQVERVGERQAQFFLASLDLVVQKDIGQEATEQETDAQRRALERQAADTHYAGQPQGDQRDDDAGDHLDDLEAVDGQPIGAPRKVDLVLDDDLAVLRHAGGEQAAQPLQHGLDEALAERQRKLDFVERQVVVAILRQPFRDQVLPGLGRHGLHRDDDAGEGQEGEDDSENTHSLHLDVRDFRDDAVADRDRDEAHPDEDVAQPFVEERRDVGRRNKRQDQRQREGQTGDDVAGGASLRGQGADLTLDPDPFPDGEGDGVQDLGQVATDDAVDLDRGDHQVEVFGFDALDHVLQGVVDRDAQVHLAHRPAELVRHRRGGALGNGGHRLRERIAGLERVGEQDDGVAQLVVEGLEPAALPELEEEPGSEVADRDADQGEDRAVEAEEQDGAEQDDQADDDHHVLRDAELEVGLGQLVGQLRAPPALVAGEALVEVLQEPFEEATFLGAGLGVVAVHVQFDLTARLPVVGHQRHDHDQRRDGCHGREDKLD